jgi:hypothetical protein
MSVARMRCSRAAVACLIAAGLCCGCASQPPSPFFQDERFLVLGVDPDAETDALARQLEANGFRIVERLRGRHFGALGAAGPDGIPAKVRVVTARGIALALDPGARGPAQPSHRYALLPPPSPETHDADGDGFEDVFVHVLPDTGEVPCIRVYRVLDSGFVDPVAGGGAPPAAGSASTHPAWREPHFCPEPGAAAGKDASAPPDAGTAPDAGTGSLPSP